MSRSTQNRLFQRRSSQPISWLGNEETKSNTTKASNTGIKWSKLTQKTQMLNLNKQKRNPSLNQHENLRTVHMCVHIIVHNCRTQYSTEQFWLFSLLTTRQSSQLRCCLLEGGGISLTNNGSNGKQNKMWTQQHTGIQNTSKHRNVHIPFFLASGSPMLSTVISEFTTSCHVVCDGHPYFRPSGVLNVYSNKKLSCQSQRNHTILQTACKFCYAQKVTKNYLHIVQKCKHGNLTISC